MALEIGKEYDLPGIGKVKIERATAKGKAKSAVQLSTGKRVNFGDPEARNAPGTERGNNYCSRSENLNERGFNANTLSRIDWGCKGSKSVDTKDMVRKEGSEYFVFNKEGTKKLSRGYPSKEEAEKRLGQIEYFKAHDKETSAQEEKFAKVLKEFEEGKLKSSSGKLITSRKQAIAVAMSESGLNK